MIFFNSSNSIHRVFLPSPPFSLSTRHPGLLLAASQLMLHYDHVMKIIRTIGRNNHLPSHPPSSPSSREWYARNYVFYFEFISLSFPVKISISFESLNLFISQFIRIESSKCHDSLIVFNILVSSSNDRSFVIYVAAKEQVVKERRRGLEKDSWEGKEGEDAKRHFH